jgi:hypothetical protein
VMLRHLLSLPLLWILLQDDIGRATVANVHKRALGTNSAGLWAAPGHGCRLGAAQHADKATRSSFQCGEGR